MRELLSIALLALVGCASTGVTPLNPGPAKPKDHPIDVYTSETEVKRPFVVCCLIDAKTGTSLFDRKTVAAALDRCKVAARKNGADAIIVMNAETDGISIVSWGQGKATVKAIRYTN
jgi:hypothetical protein